jgi:hypothetical protein
MATPRTQRAVPEVLQDIVGNFQEIIRSEFRLAKAEIKENRKRLLDPRPLCLLQSPWLYSELICALGRYVSVVARHGYLDGGAFGWSGSVGCRRFRYPFEPQQIENDSGKTEKNDC